MRREPGSVLNILIVDDNPDDRSLVIRELSEEFADCQFSQVAEPSQLTLALGRGPWDLVVTDYQLRWSDGLRVLSSVKSRWPECPVIMFTGTGGEEIAVQAMKAGLDDYVLKSPKHYARLPAAAVMALDRAKQRRALREAETRYQHLFSRVPVGLFRATSNGRITDANPAMVEMLGYPDRETLLPVDARRLFANASQRRRWLAAARRAGVVEQFELELRRYDGRLIWTEINARAVSDHQGRTQHWDGSAEDITDRKRAEEVLRDSREQLRALAAYLQSVREEERTRVAREVHGEVGQALAGVKTELAWLERKLTQGPGPASLSLVLDRLKALPGAVAATLATVEKIATELRPTVLDALGLEAAIAWQVREFEERTGIKCVFESKVGKAKLDPDRATAVFRIFQETLTVIVRHAKPTQARIYLRLEGDNLVLDVQNKGRGVTGREISDTRSLDVLGMRERATSLNGEVNIVSRQGGTRVGVRIPLHRASELKKNWPRQMR
jgi:PAS domain S-box-containing protein